jgi:hypothetical protein
LDIEKVEGVDLGGWHRLEITAALADEKREDDWFGVGTYLKLADGEALNNAKFAPQQSGLRIGAGEMNKGAQADKAIAIELVKLPKRFRFLDLLGNALSFSSAQYVNAGLSSVLRERAGGAQLDPGPARVAVGQEAWNAHAANGQVQNAEMLNSVQAFVQAKQAGGIALPATAKALDLTGVFSHA